MNEVINEKTKSECAPEGATLESGDKVTDYSAQKQEICAKNYFAELETMPIDVFPSAIREIITETKACLNYPEAYTAAGLMFAASVAVGNTMKIRIKNGYEQSAVLYLAIVGRRGTGKSHPLQFAVEPLEARDEVNFRDYQREKATFEAFMDKPARERIGEETPKKPLLKQLIIKDATPEAVAAVHACNRRGVGVAVDELKTWFGNFERYTHSAETENWLSNWTGSKMQINRKTSEPIFISRPFISVCGSIQNEVLQSLAADKIGNGFVDRILFLTAPDAKKMPLSDAELSPTVTESWRAVIDMLLNVPLQSDDNGSPKPAVIDFSPEAKAFFYQWQSALCDVSNAETETNAAILAKLECYCARFALLLETLDCITTASPLATIQLKSVEGAARLTQYFYTTAKAVRRFMVADPLAGLPDDKRRLYEALPDSFTTGEAVLIAERLGMTERTTRRFLNEAEFFTKTKHGFYEKPNVRFVHSVRFCDEEKDKTDKTDKTANEKIKISLPARTQYYNSITDAVPKWCDLNDRVIARGRAKNATPAINAQVICKDKRSMANIVRYTGLLHVDLDHVSDVEGTLKQCRDSGYFAILGVSHSGQGVYGFAYTDDYITSVEDYKAHWHELTRRLEAIGLQPDQATKDPTRLRIAGKTIEFADEVRPIRLHRPSNNNDRSKQGVIDFVLASSQGERNTRGYWAAQRFKENSEWDMADLEHALRQIGLPEKEVKQLTRDKSWN